MNHNQGGLCCYVFCVFILASIELSVIRTGNCYHSHASLNCSACFCWYFLAMLAWQKDITRAIPYSLVTLFSLLICADCRIFDNRRTDETAGDRILEMVVPKEASGTLDAAKILESGRRPLESTNVASASSHIASVPRIGHPLSTLD